MMFLEKLKGKRTSRNCQVITKQFLSSDYDATDKATQMFFAHTQNKLLFAVTGKTAAEIVISRASADKENMGLTSWKGSVVRKQDIIISKNYLSENEIDTLNRLTVIFLETAELTVKDRNDLTLAFWKENVNKLLDYQNKNILQGSGSITNAEMKIMADNIYQTFNKNRITYNALNADKEDIEEIENIEKQLKRRKK